VLAGIVMLAIGIFAKSATALGVGVVLAGLGGLATAANEHFAGFRSHTTLLAGTVFVVVVGGLFYLAGLVLAVCLAVGAVAFLATFLLLRRAFQRASGGLSFKVGRFGGG
jgi:ABC-type siderophore export system fused ATPase/permease subunit